MKESQIQAIVLQTAGILVLATLMLQFAIFEKSSIPGYFSWPLLFSFVAMVIFLAPTIGKNSNED